LGGSFVLFFLFLQNFSGYGRKSPDFRFLKSTFSPGKSGLGAVLQEKAIPSASLLYRLLPGLASFYRGAMLKTAGKTFFCERAWPLLEPWRNIAMGSFISERYKAISLLVAS